MSISIAETRSTNVESNATALKQYRRIVVLTDGFSTPYSAKTAMSLLRYRSEDVIAIMDSAEEGKCAGPLFGVGGETPMVASIDGLNADALFLGTATPGGKLPLHWREILLAAIRSGIDIVSGLHEFLADDPEFAAAADQHGCRLIDVRQNDQRETARCQPFREGCLRIHAVGHDCSVGKMVVTLEVQRELARRGADAAFVATGQTGIMISGEGIPIDCVVSDFVNGSAEALVRRNESHDVLLIEGQGSISHPSFSAVTTGLLHGSAPHGLIFCYEVGRAKVKGLEHIDLLPNNRLIEIYEAMAALRLPCRVIGIAMNSRSVTAEEAATERERVQSEFGLPVCDVYRDGAAVLADAVLSLQQELKK